MAELTLRIVVDPATGRRELVVELAREPDALPAEHEDEHRRLASAVAPGATFRREAAGAVGEAAPEAEREAEGKKEEA